MAGPVPLNQSGDATLLLVVVLPSEKFSVKVNVEAPLADASRMLRLLNVAGLVSVKVPLVAIDWLPPPPESSISALLTLFPLPSEYFPNWKFTLELAALVNAPVVGKPVPEGAPATPA